MELDLDFDDTPSCVADCPPPGIYQDVPFEQYASWRAINSGVVKWMKVSPKHGQAALNGEIRSDDTRSMKLGRAIHCRILEPDTFADRFIVSRNCEAELKSGDRKGHQCGCNATFLGLDGRFYCGKHSPQECDTSREIITAEEGVKCERVALSLKDHPACKLIRRKGWSETSIVWEHAGMKMKGRMDRHCGEGPRPIVLDIKKCRVGYGTTEECQKAILNYDYHIQAAGYCKGAEQVTGDMPEFIWVFVEDGPPFDVQIKPASPQDIEIGWHFLKSAVEAYKYAIEANDVFGYVKMTTAGNETITNIHPGGLPAWYVKQCQQAGIV